MRTTLNTIYSSINSNLNRITTDMLRINNQLSSGRQMSTISDNPVNLVNALGYRTTLAQIDQYVKNINYGNTIITSSESALTQIKEQAIRGKTLALQSGNAGMTQANLLQIAEEVDTLLQQSITLGNSQQAGKFIFGGLRTTGYTVEEPAPFIQDKGNGHWINGTTLSPLSDALLTGTIDNSADIADGDLLINGVNIGPVALNIAAGPADYGLNMGSADNLRTAINAQSATSNVSARFTTLYAGPAATADTADATDTVFSFDVNGETISVTIPDNSTATQTATLTAAAVAAASNVTGVTAERGTGANGGIADSVVFRNVISGDESAINIDNYVLTQGDATPGFQGAVPIAQTADATHNTGEISLYSTEAYTLTSPNHNDDTILDLLGLGGGGVGYVDDAGDGSLVNGYQLDTGDLLINGLAVPAAADDGLTTAPATNLYTNASAAAKAAAINSVADQTGVSAYVTPVEHYGSASVEGGTVNSRLTGLVTNTVILAGDLAINDTPLGTINPGAVTRGLNMEKASNARTAINAVSGTTNVTGSLTTLTGGTVAATAGASVTPVEFTINGETITFGAGGISANDTANSIVDAINAMSDITGVTATKGNDSNGGIDNSIILSNAVKGNEAAITLAGLSAAETALTGLTNHSQAADITHNTGEISLASDLAFTVSSPTTGPGADMILNELGLSSESADGVGAGSTLTATLPTGALAGIAAGELAVNGYPITGAINGAPTNGVNMAMAAAAATEIENADPSVTVNLTTLTSSGAAANSLVDSDVTFYLNGQQINVTTNAGDGPDVVAQAAVDAINLVTSQTGVEAFAGDGANGGALNSVVFRNAEPGDESAISVSSLTVNSGNNDLGFTDFGPVSADATHNSGEITITSAQTFDLSSPTTLDDTFLTQLGLGGGSIGYSDTAGDGLIYGTAGTGTGQLTSGATPEFLDENDLIINGIDIFDTSTPILAKDKSNALVTAINAKTDQTGIQATVNTAGKLLLTAVDGRNLHIQTSTQGESVTHLNGGSQNQVYFGSLQLYSDRRFTLQTTPGPLPNLYEPGLATIGMAGGESLTGEPDDIAGDGKIDVFSIHDQEGSVRYTGDRENNLEIKVGQSSTIEVGQNGQEAISEAEVFTTTQKFADALRGKNFFTVTGAHQATDTSALLNSRDTGLEPETLLPDENLFRDGSFTVNIADHDYSPPRMTGMTIPVNTEYDTLESVAQKINGIPYVNAEWTADGELKISTTDSDRYTISLENDSSNFLEATGTSFEFMQDQAIEQALDNYDALQENLSARISDFGARANRIQVQTQIYEKLDLTNQENLSEVQDTDMIEAIMQLQAKEVAYQAALSAAAKTMQLSLVDYL
ncbi:MAG: hypothetical protein KQH63_15880 [Desulfobulbaceae bacterium]|nr:hypothetical protein [Desulfobulbaceae bacterium]